MMAETSTGATFVSTEDRKITIAPLAGQHIVEVFSLFEDVKRIAPNGHLSERPREEMLREICNPSTSASVGAWQGGRLVAYSLCSKDSEGAYANVPLAGLLRARDETIWTGKGTVVRPGSEGQLLMPRLLKARGDLMKSRNASHSIGLIAVDNIASLAGAFRAGANVIGMMRDDYCLNFVCYAGALINEFALCNNDYAELKDVGKITGLIAGSWIGTSLGKDPSSGLRMMNFKYCPLAAGFRRENS